MAVSMAWGIVDLQRRPGSNKSLGERNCRTLAYIVGEGFERQTPDNDLAVTQLVTEVVLYAIEHDFILWPDNLLQSQSR